MWLKPKGYAEIVSPDFGVASLDHIRKENINIGVNGYDTATCYHCNRVFHVSARMRPEDIGGMCPQCWQIICPNCLDKPCRPWEKYLEDQERAIEKARTVAEYFK